MNVYHDLDQLPSFRNAVVTIGSFDGVHRGHQIILEQVKTLANTYKGESIVVTFHPHPRLVIYPEETNLQLLTSIDEKINLLKRFGIDNVVVVPFTRGFSQLTAAEYIERFLIEKFNPKCIVIGYDHRFGSNREGDIGLIRTYAERHAFELIEIQKQQVDEITVSSTKVRNALLEGKVRQAHQLLGHYFTLTGVVVKGRQIGTKIGFPTANLNILFEHKLVPPDGIYAVYVQHQQTRYKGMLYIGLRPTLQDKYARSIEVNIFDFNKNIYGDKLVVELAAFIRSDAQFDDLEQLTNQLKEDERKVKQFFFELRKTNQQQQTNQHEASVAVVILNYNGCDYLEQFLPSILESTYPNTSVYVADNASTDDSLIWLKQHYPDIQLIELAENFGFAEGYNRALAQVEADYFVLLNSDVEVTPNWIEPIVELMERDPSVAACQPKILSYHRKTHFEYAGAAGGWMDRINYPFCRGRIFDLVEKDEGQYDVTQEVFWASGAALFIRVKLYRDMQGFAGNFFAHQEEIDLCWRLKRAGYKIMVRPKSVIHHVGGATLTYSSPQKTYLNFRNSLFAIVRNERSNKLWSVIFLRLLLDGVAALAFLLKGRIKHIAAIFRAHWHFFPRILDLLKERRVIADQIERISIGRPNDLTGKYAGSIIWQYYIMGRKKFKQLIAK